MVHSNFRRISPPKKNLAKPGRNENVQRLVFQDCIKPAPMVMKPFSSLINPFRHGCSIFCNHPTKNVQLKMAIEKTKRKRIDDEREAEMMGQVLEDIICKYGAQSVESETAVTTPESEILPPPRPQLVLNLRRTASQETGRTSGGMQSTFSPSPSSLCGRNVKLEPTSGSPGPLDEIPTESRSEAEAEEEEGKSEVVRRRGKIRKKRKKTMLEIEKGEKEVIDLIEPKDTLVSTCRTDGTDYESDDFDIEKTRAVNKCASSHPTPPLMESDLFDNKTLRHLRRSLSLSDIESEFRRIWKRVLQEALGACKILPRDEVKLDDGIKVAPCEPEKWLCYPRTYKRSDSRFDLPIDKRILCDMKPLQYLKDYVYFSKSNLLLYRHVFDKYKEEDTNITGKVITKALGEVMGCEFNEEEDKTFKELVDLKEEDHICFKTWLGLCSFSERLFGEKFCAGKTTDCGERDTIEVLDFECLEKRLPKLVLNEKILKLLKAIESS